MRCTKSFLHIILFLLLALSPLYAADFYWENPTSVSQGYACFPTSAKNTSTFDETSVVLWQEAQDGKIFLSSQILSQRGTGGEWITKNRFAGPFPYSGDVPQISSVSVNNKGTVSFAVISAPNTISIFLTDSSFSSFREVKLNQSGRPLVAPRIYRTSDDRFMLFASQGEEDSFSLMVSTSNDGISWSPFSVFSPSREVSNPFIPILSQTPWGDLVIFQGSYSSGIRLSYQLYSTVSNDGGTTWSRASIVTGENTRSSSETLQVFTNYLNQRPSILQNGNKVYIAWERTYYSSENAQIYFAELINSTTLGPIERITPGSGNASNPVLFNYDNTISLVWFDTRRGNEALFLAQQNGFLWNEQTLSTGTQSALFGQPLVSGKGSRIDIFWQRRQNGSSSILRLSPDRSVNPPSITSVSFAEGKKSNAERVNVKVVLPQDSSGIAGFSYSWTQNPFEEPPLSFMNLPSQTDITAFADKDGSWYFKARVLDYAGNWSSPSSVMYVKDTTPPVKPRIISPSLDTEGFLVSNTFSVQWEAGEEDDISGYTYAFEYMGESAPNPLTDDTAFSRQPSKPPARLLTAGTQISFTNRDNGLYALSVAAIDSVGNIGPSEIIKINLNKFIPYTTITSILTDQNDFGDISVTIIGRGYITDGFIDEIYIDEDGIKPYTRTLSRENGDFTLTSDRRITGITLKELEEGSYRIILNHFSRGLYVSGKIVHITQTGTVKLGDYTYTFEPQWSSITDRRTYSIQITHILLMLLVFFVFGGMIVSLRGIALAAKDAAIIKQEVRALITGDAMPYTKKQKTAELQNRGISLKYKLMFFTASLIVLIILLVSIPLGFLMINTQEQTLAQGLEQRTNVLLESLSSSVKAYLPSQNVLELSFLPNQSNALSEAQYATITGLSADGSNTSLRNIWATNDPDILSNIDSEILTYGTSRYTRDYIEGITEKTEALNTTAVERVDEIARTITELTTEGIRLAARTDTASVERLAEIQKTTRELNERLTSILNELSAQGSGSFPHFDSGNLSRENTEYIFYKPVLYRQGSEKNFVRGLVILSVSTESLIDTVENARDNILLTTLIVALIAVAFGLITTLILASIIIKPIRRLASHVAMIRDTDDKEELEGKDLKLKSRDEIGLLGETVNDMAHGLIKAAAASKDLTVGKEVQKMFIPLETDESGKKLTTGKEEDSNAQFFGYYEGAKGVSGDYFDYKKLDDRWFALIKCDVSGKGVPAALIMVEVATLFLNYFKDWTFKTHGTKLNTIVSQINDLIESRGFKGRFAAFTLCLFDSKSGELHFCNAGDNLIHIYDASEKKKKTIALPEAAAAGVFPSFMVDMKGGFQTQKMQLDKNDVLFLYTDGIEEAKRNFRNKEMNIITCEEPGLEKESPHGFHIVGQDNEEMAPERVNAIIEAVFSKSIYTLHKYHNHIDNEVLEFDFTTLEGNAEDAIMALVSVEKIFRMYKDPNATDFDRVQVDRKIDTFLNLHFKQYESYCSDKMDHPSLPEYLLYKKAKEDAQYDDLTLMAIKKK